jgi:hypothetical protein
MVLLTSHINTVTVPRLEGPDLIDLLVTPQPISSSETGCSHRFAVTRIRAQYFELPYTLFTISSTLPTFLFRIPAGAQCSSRHTQPPIQWAPGGGEGSFPRGKAAGARISAIDLQLVLRSRIRASVHPLPHAFMA